MSSDLRTKMWQAMDQSPNVMVSLLGNKVHSEPMRAVLDKNADHEFWFYTSKDNRCAQGGQAMVQFASKGHDIFACIRGRLAMEERSDIIDKYWNKHVAAWYPDGREDDSLLMLRFELEDAEIWQVDPSIKGLFKLWTGKTIDPNEMGEHDKVSM